jgi:hypothetical protein
MKSERTMKLRERDTCATPFAAKKPPGLPRLEMDSHLPFLDLHRPALTSVTSLPDTPPYRTLIWCSHCPRLPPQRRHLEGA